MGDTNFILTQAHSEVITCDYCREKTSAWIYDHHASDRICAACAVLNLKYWERTHRRLSIRTEAARNAEGYYRQRLERRP